MITIDIVADKALVFDVQDVRKLRELGITGVLSGTLPAAPQQNIFQGLPLQLMVEEVIWLVLNNHAIAVPSQEFFSRLADTMSVDEKREYTEAKNNVEFSYESNRFVQINDNSKDLNNYNNELMKYQNTEKEMNLIKKQLSFDAINYKIFEYLKNHEYFLAPGLRFGSKFIAYPGDPLRYHAHLIVNPIQDFYNQDIEIINIVSGGRLATGVKKIWLISGCKKGQAATEDPEEDVCNFSIEWSGFG